ALVTGAARGIGGAVAAALSAQGHPVALLDRDPGVGAAAAVLPGPAVGPVDDLSSPQRFFLSYARAWQTKRRDEALRQQVATDPHSPEEFRVNQVVRNVDAYYDAFAVRPGDAAWLDPEQRVTIW
ncbi:MAG: M13-type metalloendopeptidase, partial [Propionicimonas sp.]|nr:M13-type metalloendopeptidase [Propionicimonas sp.]